MAKPIFLMQIPSAADLDENVLTEIRANLMEYLVEYYVLVMVTECQTLECRVLSEVQNIEIGGIDFNDWIDIGPRITPN